MSVPNSPQSEAPTQVIAVLYTWENQHCFVQLHQYDIEANMAKCEFKSQIKIHHYVYNEVSKDQRTNDVHILKIKFNSLIF